MKDFLKSIYKTSIYYPSAVLLGLGFLYPIAYRFIVKNAEEEYSEHSLNLFESIVAYVLIALMFSIVLAILSLPIFLNTYEKIRSNIILSALSWFLLPCGFISLVIGKAINEFITVDSLWEIIFGLIGGIPFIISLLIGFRKLRSLEQGD